MKRILVDDMSCEAIGAIGVLLAIRGKSMDDVEIVDIESERKRGLKEAVTPTLIQITPSLPPHDCILYTS